VLQEDFVVRPVALEIECRDALPLDRHELVHALKQFERVFRAVLDLGRFFLRADLAADFLKEPLSFLASRSGTAVVHPIDWLCHDSRLPIVNTSARLDPPSPTTPRCRPAD
jgi:hypothetical protein